MMQRIQRAEEANSSPILSTKGQLGKALYIPATEVSTNKQGGKLESVAGILSHYNLISTTQPELNPESDFNLFKG